MTACTFARKSTSAGLTGRVARLAFVYTRDGLVRESACLGEGGQKGGKLGLWLVGQGAHACTGAEAPKGFECGTCWASLAVVLANGLVQRVPVVTCRRVGRGKHAVRAVSGVERGTCWGYYGEYTCVPSGHTQSIPFATALPWQHWLRRGP